MVLIGTNIDARESQSSVQEINVNEALSKGKIHGLDGIRAIAILLVILSHSGLTKEYTGRTGVSIFFFLSGFLITTLLERERANTGRVSAVAFYVRRAFRILPPLYLTIAAGCLACWLGVIGGTVTLRPIVYAVGFLGNYFMLNPAHSWPDGFGILWSLAVEEHFYMVFPLVYIAIAGWSLRGKVTLLSALCALALIWRFVVVFALHKEGRMYLATDTRFDSILFGCILALVFRRVDAGFPQLLSNRFSGWLALLGAAGTLVFDHIPHIKGPLAYTLTSVSLIPVFTFILKNPGHRAVRWLEWRWLARIGVLSYSIYLFHEMCLSAAARIVPFPRPVCMLLSLPVCYLIALGIDRFVDKPSHAVRERLLRRIGRGKAAPALKPTPILVDAFAAPSGRP